MSLYRISKTSSWDSNVPPVAGARQEPIEFWDVRTCSSPEEFDACKIDVVPWLQSGTEHSVIDVRGKKMIRRRIHNEQTQWVIEIPDLVQFAAEHGNLVLSAPEQYKVVGVAYPEVEIYDDYRE